MEYPDGFLASHVNRGICGVLSVAICADVSFDTAKAACKVAMHELRLGQRFRGGTSFSQRKRALSLLATKFVEHDRFVGWKVSEFISVANPAKTYMVTVNRHVVTVRGGKICDQGNLAWYANHRCRNRKIEKPVIEITGKGW